MGSAVVCLGSVCGRGCYGREMSSPAEGPLCLGLGWGAPWGPCSGYGDSPASQEPGGTDRVQFLSVWAAEHFHHWHSLGLGGWICECQLTELIVTAPRVLRGVKGLQTWETYPPLTPQHADTGLEGGEEELDLWLMRVRFGTEEGKSMQSDQ